MDEEILYDDVAMENVHSLLVAANTKLISAKEKYNSDKLSGRTLVNNVESFIDEISPLLSSYNHASEGINEGSFDSISFDLSGNQGMAGGDSAPISINDDSQNSSESVEWTEESVDAYENEIQNDLSTLEMIIELSEEEENTLRNILLVSGPDGAMSEYGLESINGMTYATPEEYEKYLIMQVDGLDQYGVYNEEIYNEQINAAKEAVRSYKLKFYKAFKAEVGVPYREFMERLNELQQLEAKARPSKYALQQLEKLIPYLRIMLTEEYKAFARGEYDFYTLHVQFPDLYYSENGIENSYLNEEEQMMLLYLFETEGYSAALEYLSAKEDTINNRIGQRAAEEVLRQITDENGEVDATALNTLLLGMEGFEDGVATFLDGIGNIFRTEGMISSTQYKQMYLLAALEKADNGDSTILSFSYQNGSAIGNMAIPMLLSASGLGSIFGSTLMGLSAGGNAKNQALIDGYSAPEAYMYGIFSGSSESIVGYFLGKIPGLSETSGFTLKNLFSEGFEEFSQEWFDAGLRAVLLGEDVDWGSVGDDAIKSFIMGMIISGELNGASAIAISVNGNNVEIPFKEIEEYCKAHPEISVADALVEILLECNAKTDSAQNDKGNVLETDQHILDIIFSGGMDSISSSARKKAFDIVNMFKSEFLTFSEKVFFNNNTKFAERFFNEFCEKFSNPDTTVIKTGGNNMIARFLNFLLSQGKIGTEIVQEYENGINPIDTGTIVEIDGKQISLRDYIIDYMKQKGMSAKETIKAFSNYDSASGGICSYDALCRCIYKQLTEQQFKDHFGFEKYVVTTDGKILYNPILLADMVFTVNQEGNIRKPNFVCENGEWHIIDGKLNGNSFGSSKLSFDLYKANEYLKSKGLKIDELAKQAAQQSSYSPKLSGIPESGIEVSADYLKFIAETALNEGYSLQFDIFGGKLIGIDNKNVIDYTNKAHAVNVTGMNEEGFIVATYAGEYLFPYEDVKFFEKTFENGTTESISTVGYSVLKISEIGG